MALMVKYLKEKQTKKNLQEKERPQGKTARKEKFSKPSEAPKKQHGEATTGKKKRNIQYKHTTHYPNQNEK